MADHSTALAKAQTTCQTFRAFICIFFKTRLGHKAID
ncbi:hypothetical protein SHM7688_00693 [Shimia marina]|uniref:Uncharacterized protein n=1 Tax=Shimia marina TaxID=321267 RepID=A0A0P1EMJ2_9RHOB|nr:hypothetical protein SHM7688_00693 [Shimia marina]